MLLEDLQVVLKVAEFKSITAAAESLDMRTATASAALKRVEKNIGVELFVRTTRQLRLSSAGEHYIPYCEQALQMLSQAQQSIKDDLGIIDGELRLSVPSDLGRNYILPWLDELMAEHQGVSIKVDIRDSNIDFYRDPVDIALRYGSPNDASLYGFKICNVPRLLCASPEYLAEHGTPKHPNELVEHNALLYQLHDIIYNSWEFSDNGTPFKVKVKGRHATNDAELVRRWCVAGKGIATKSPIDMSDDIFKGKIVSLLSEYQPKPTELWLVCPSRQSITPAVRLLRDMVKEKCRAILAKLVEQGVLTEEELN